MTTTYRQYRPSSRLLELGSSKHDGPMETVPDTQVHQELCKLQHADEFLKDTACKDIKAAKHYQGGDLLSVFL